MSELQWPAKKVRETYFHFFMEKLGHTLWPSSSVVPHDDPTLLFTSDGMSQFKAILLGTVDPNTELGKLRRACSSQKCIRAGESHKDLETVGTLNYPHTFFEMLGNWSFGDYFKKEAIRWAWELLTEVYGLSADRICATYFGGDEKAGLRPDDEARDIWLEFLPSPRVVPIGYKGNFWEMGGTGLCGPCTKIYYKREEDGTCIELWNLVFIQFNRKIDGSLKPLAAKSVGTGMGLERLASVLQNKMSSYDTNIFLPIYEDIQKATGIEKKYDREITNVSEAYRVVVDHIRTLSFAIADGAHLGNEGREHALRRIFHRAVRYGMQFLEAKEGFFSGVVNSLARVMGDVFTELKDHEDNIIKILKQEESSFCKIMQLVLDLNDAKKPDDLRAKALNELTKERDQDLAHLLWYSQGTASLLVKEIAQSTSNPLTWDRANHVSKLFCLLECLVELPEARVSLLRGLLPLYLYPFVQATSTEEPTEFLRKGSLDLLAALVTDGDAAHDAVSKLINSRIVETCLRSLPLGSLPSREAAVSLIAKLLQNDVCYIYVIADRRLLFELIHGLSLMLSVVEEKSLPQMLKIIIPCFHRLSENPSIRYELRRLLPRSVQDDSFRNMLADNAVLLLDGLQDNLRM